MFELVGSHTCQRQHTDDNHQATQNGVFAEAEQTENHAQDSYRHEEQCNAGTHQPAYRVGITCNHNLARFLGGNAYTLFQTFVSSIMRFQEDGTQRRTQGQGVQSRETDGNRHGQTELTVESTCRTSHEAHGNEYGHHHQRNGDDGTTQFTHGVDGSCTGRFVALVQLGMDALDDDDGIIDHNRNGKHHGRKGQQVDTEANQFQYEEGGNQRHGNGDGGNQRGAHILQEDIHYDEHQDKGLDQCLDYLMYGSEEEVVGTLCNVYLQAGGQFAGIVVQ